MAGLFNNLGTLKPGVEKWDAKLVEAINIYKRRREEGNNSSQPHSVSCLPDYMNPEPLTVLNRTFIFCKYYGQLLPGHSMLRYEQQL